MPLKIVGESNLGPKYATLSKGFPAWVQAVDKMPKSSAIIGGLAVCSVMSFFVWAVMGARGQKVSTLSDDWKAANKDYMKFQKMNPIFGISSKGGH